MGLLGNLLLCDLVCHQMLLLQDLPIFGVDPVPRWYYSNKDLELILNPEFTRTRYRQTVPFVIVF
jgi:hypothetical protein